MLSTLAGIQTFANKQLVLARLTSTPVLSYFWAARVFIKMLVIVKFLTKCAKVSPAYFSTPKG